MRKGTALMLSHNGREGVLNPHRIWKLDPTTQRQQQRKQHWKASLTEQHRKLAWPKPRKQRSTAVVTVGEVTTVQRV